MGWYMAKIVHFVFYKTGLFIKEKLKSPVFTLIVQIILHLYC